MIGPVLCGDSQIFKIVTMLALRTFTISLSKTLWAILLFTLILRVEASQDQSLGTDYYGDQAEDEYGHYEYEELVQDDVEEPSAIPTERPVIVSPPEHSVVDNGMTISLPCLVEKMPAGVQIMWQKMDEKKTIIAVGTRVIDPQLAGRAFVTVLEGKGSTLAIGAANTDDAGQYKCEVLIQNNPPDLKHTVSIRAPPSISSFSPSSITVEKGQDVTLSCKGKGMPEPSIKWTRESGHSRKMPNGQDQMEDDVITLSMVTKNDAGIYRCTASNGHGSGATKQMEVIVRYAPEITISEMLVHQRTGDAAELVCGVHAFPPPTVIWTKGRTPVGNTDRITVSNRGGRHSITITQVEKSDFGEYVCQASNELGDTKSSPILLSGHAKPAQFKSNPVGDKPTAFLIQWTSFSFTPINEFSLETSTSPTGPWTPHTLTTPPTKEETEAFVWAGKFYLTELQESTQYFARVSVNNAEGWGKPGPVWNFATKGAAPQLSLHSDSGSERLSYQTTLLVLICVVTWVWRDW